MRVFLLCKHAEAKAFKFGTIGIGDVGVAPGGKSHNAVTRAENSAHESLASLGFAAKLSEEGFGLGSSLLCLFLRLCANLGRLARQVVLDV